MYSVGLPFSNVFLKVLFIHVTRRLFSFLFLNVWLFNCVILLFKFTRVGLVIKNVLPVLDVLYVRFQKCFGFFSLCSFWESYTCVCSLCIEVSWKSLLCFRCLLFQTVTSRILRVEQRDSYNSLFRPFKILFVMSSDYHSTIHHVED